MKSKKIQATILTIILATLLTQAVSIYEAETYYKSATAFYKEDDWENSLRDIERAKEIFGQLNDKNGISKSNKFIYSKLDSILTPAQMAGMYFNIGGDYYIQAENTDIELLTRAHYFSNECELRYRNISGSIGSSGVLKCEDLNGRVTDIITKIKSSKINDAKLLYEQSQIAYRENNLVTARDLILNSSKIYHTIPDQNGIAKTAALLTSIEERIQNIKVNAATSYKSSLDLTVIKQWDQAKEFAIASQNLYEKIGDEEGYLKAAQLLNRINDELSFSREQRLQQAQSLFLLAQESYTLQQYANATTYANEAKRIYTQFLEEAKIREADIPSHKRKEEPLFREYIDEVNKLLHEIFSDYGYERMLEQSEKLYEKAQEYYTLNRLEDALAYARNAYTMYEELDYYIGMSKTQSLANTIGQRMEKQREAASILDVAITYYKTAEYENSYFEASRALHIYQELWMTEKVLTIEELIENISTGRIKKSTADNHFSQALGHMEALNYRQSLENAQKSNKIYREINFSMGITESDRLITESQKQIDEEKKRFRNTIIIVGVIGIVILLVILSWRSRTKQIEEEYVSQIQKDKEVKRREKEAWTLEKEEETKDAVEDELRRLIREERQLGDE